MAMFGIPINFTASVMHGWKLGKTMCNVFGFALTLGGKLKKYKNIIFSQGIYDLSIMIRIACLIFIFFFRHGLYLHIDRSFHIPVRAKFLQ